MTTSKTSKISKKVFYEPNKTYAITLNPIDKHQFFHRVDRYQRFRSFVFEQMFDVDRNNFDLYIELSEPRGMIIQGKSGPRYHMHGTIKWRTYGELRRFLSNDYYKLLRWTSVDIESIDDLQLWHGYCTKQSELIPKQKII